MFSNHQILIDNLPKSEEVTFTRLDSKLRVRMFINRAIFSLFLCIVITAFYLTLEMWIAHLASIPFIIAIVLIMIWPIFSYPKKSMALREHDILYKSGVLWKSYKAIPFNRLQHIELRRSPVDRGLDLATLTFFTAGGNYGDLNIAGFRYDQAQQIRERILEIMNKEEHDDAE